MRISAILISCVIISFSVDVRSSTHQAIHISVAPAANSMTLRYAKILRDELTRSSAVQVTVGSEAGREASSMRLEISTVKDLEGQAVRPGLSPRELPSETDPGPEGFLLKRHENTVSVVGVDQRGVLYGIGELLRRIVVHEDAVEVPGELNVRSAPAFEVRGTGVSQGHTITQLTGSRKWTEDEWQRAVIGYALAGANTIDLDSGVSELNARYQFVRGLGLKILVGLNPNVGGGPPEWAAKEAIGRSGYLCLSVPEARKARMNTAVETWKSVPPVDYVRMKSGDGGGCECERCRPYGRVYIEMCHDIAEVIHQHQPDAEVFVLNQKLDNAGDLALFRYLREHSGSWMRAVAIGPGSNAMGWMPGRRQDHRMDLFRYPAFGAMDRYYREMLQQLPPGPDLVFFTDITHWVYAQNGLMDHALIPDRNHQLPPASDHYIYDRHPDPALYQVYDRRAFNARPHAYYDFFRESLRYGIGDVTYSEGHHDHFNNWMWQRLLWSPDTSLDDVIAQYALRFFGPAAAAPMAQAIPLFESNLQTPIADNPGVQRFAELVRTAGHEMPDHLMKTSYLWREYMQRALTDLYIQDDVTAQRDLLKQLLDIAAEAKRPDQVASVIRRLKRRLDMGIQRDPRAEEWKAKALRLGAESDQIYGVQIAGTYNLDQDYVGLGWHIRQIEEAEQESSEEAVSTLSRLTDYEMQAAGALYDDLGNPDRSPHITIGWPFGDGIFDPSSRDSQRSSAFTTDEEQGVTLEYTDLDPDKQYIARMTLVRPRYLPRFGMFQHQTNQSIYADDVPLASDMELPEYTPQQFEFVIPKAVTADGRLVLRCLKQAGVGEGDPGDITVWRNTGGWGTLLSEVWLYSQAP